MKIVDVQWYNYRLPFRNSFTTAHGVITAREGIVVEITTESGISGIGEVAPLPAFGRESLADIRSLLPILAARLRNQTLAEALKLIDAESKGDRESALWLKGISTPSVLCGLEIALLDALGKAEGCTVSALLAPVGTPPRASVPVNAVIGSSATGAAIVAAKEARKHGYRCVKLKVALGGSISAEVERIAAVRAAIGPAMHLRLDANEGWQLEQAISILSQCVPYEIQYVEQPLPAHDLTGMRTLRQAVSIPIAVDEALHDLESAQRILANEAADIFVIKPQLAGGLRAGQQMMAAATERGVRSVITSTLEAGIGLVAALHLAAASPAVTLECGLATLGLLVDNLVMDNLPVREGFLAVPTGPGLGITLNREALNRYAF
ncbi:MAG TPA: o-succinylbenzoate synthase [Ktedonobacteraceae bacterium]|nr:o-succinylbenzoate synthase [Ktedonobacteraceae bacterium]